MVVPSLLELGAGNLDEQLSLGLIRHDEAREILAAVADRVRHLTYPLTGALAWEMFGELREEVSINDVIVTSTSGLAIGETLAQPPGVEQ